MCVVTRLAIGIREPFNSLRVNIFKPALVGMFRLQLNMAIHPLRGYSGNDQLAI